MLMTPVDREAPPSSWICVCKIWILCKCYRARGTDNLVSDTATGCGFRPVSPTTLDETHHCGWSFHPRAPAGVEAESCKACSVQENSRRAVTP